MDTSTPCGPPPTRWYVHPYFAAGLTAAAAIGSSFVLKRMEPEGALRVAASLMSVPPSAFLVWTFVHWIRALDELHHRIVFEAVAVAFVLSFLVAIAMEGLQNAGIVTSFEWEHAWEGMALFYVSAYAWAQRRYR
ncbi:MAG TPA: hypothetical protein VEX86_09400 [Longimicrobium sp.]|nr:hypothetical protein [Longimicrobium sp.]